MKKLVRVLHNVWRVYEEDSHKEYDIEHSEMTTKEAIKEEALKLSKEDMTDLVTSLSEILVKKELKDHPEQRGGTTDYSIVKKEYGVPYLAVKISLFDVKEAKLHDLNRPMTQKELKELFRK